MSDTVFRCKQFSVRQSSDVFKVSTDSVLLGSWVNVSNAQNILEIGSGTGILSLMTAQKNDSARITSIDFSKKAADLTHENFHASTWKDRLKSRHIPIRTFYFVHEHHNCFDHIISNPPYFENSLRSSRTVNIEAKHMESLTLNDLVQASLLLLSNDGLISIILPVQPYEKLLKMLLDRGFHLHRYTEFYSRKELPLKRILASFSKRKRPYKSNQIIMYLKDGRYHPSYVKLLADFLIVL